ncbi:MAG: B12-binding domain-containing radical SAM protein [Tissierellia bacterium]|nr:B12-binding domain-containing radical SAM protein [Tissierellia bacterium]
MKVLLTTLNSKFIHSSLSIRYLKSYCKDLLNIELMEFTINQNIDYILGEIYKANPDIVGFSTYIWNREETLKVCEALKIVAPNIKILLGGPEVSFDSIELMKKYPFIDFIIAGEGEIPFKEFLKTTVGDEGYSKVNGLIYRQDGNIFKNPLGKMVKNLDDIPSPYLEEDLTLENKIVYYESSRGCPFNCQFCLSSTIKGVRYFSLSRVKEDLERLIDRRVMQVKFVDRTFNANKKFAMEIMQFIMDKDPDNMNFHFEVTAHLVDDEMLEFIKKAKPGLFQFEIGVQSTNEKTIEAVGRTTNFEKLREVTKKIKSFGNIHQHLDLIAGLPYEGYESFKKSFNDVYEIGPEKIQLGFLKLLKGSGLRKDKDKYGFKFIDTPPYEVLETNYISYGEMLKLKGIEDLVEKYYNEGYFRKTIEYIVEKEYPSAFDFFEVFLEFWVKKGYHRLNHSRLRLYEILWEFVEEKKFEDKNIINELMKFDFIFNNPSPNIPKFLKRVDVKSIEKKKHEILKDGRLLNNVLYHLKDIPTKKIIRKVHIEVFEIDVLKLIENNYNLKEKLIRPSYLLFEYTSNSQQRCKVYDVTKYIERSGLNEYIRRSYLCSEKHL